MGKVNFYITGDDIVNEANPLLLPNNFVIFEKAFFDYGIPEPISSITNANQ